MTGYFLNDSSYLRVWTEGRSNYVERNFIKIQSPKTLVTEMSVSANERSALVTNDQLQT